MTQALGGAGAARERMPGCRLLVTLANSVVQRRPTPGFEGSEIILSMLEPLDRDPINLETLQLFRRVLGSDSRPDDPKAVEAFVANVSDALHRVASNASRLRGIRTQALFAQLIVALDACELMLTVDAGDIYADGFLSSGDFLLALRDGRRLLIEVKTVSRSYNAAGELDLDRSQRKEIRAKDVEGLRRAATLLGAEPFFAAYFEFMHRWALVRLDDLAPKGTNYTLLFTHDIMLNHMSILGDRTLGIEPPVEIRLHPAPGAEPVLRETVEEVEIPFTVARRTVHVGGQHVTDSDDMEFAIFLGIYGNWEPEFVPFVKDKKVEYVSIHSGADEPVEGQGFQIVGELSHLYSKYFMVRTSNEDGESAALDIEATPSMIAKYRLRDPKDRQFRTWQLEVRASEAEVTTDTSNA